MEKKKGVFNQLWRGLEFTIDVLSSLKLAVLVILALAVGLAAATFIESLYDTASAQYWVYQAKWFYALLGLLGLNIFAVALSRLPWKRSHIPFLLAHLGILILLVGSWITQRAAIDGSIRVTEGEAESIVELDQASLILSHEKQIFTVPIPWQPPTVAFHPISTRSAQVPYDLTVDQFLSRADRQLSFVPEVRPGHPSQHSGMAALKVRIQGGPMRISQEFWLFQGAPNWRELQAGPARLFFTEKNFQEGQSSVSSPWLGFLVEKDGSLSYLAQSSSGAQVRGRLGANQIQGKVIRPGWKGDVSITLVEWIAEATPHAEYQPARIQYGPQAPSSAIHVVTAKGEGVWLGLGDRATLEVGDQTLSIGYYPRRVMLPFTVRLDRFSIEHDPGTLRAAAYSSQVTVLDEGKEVPATISMNEPLERKGFTVYQASYEDASPRPVTSIFTVNRDPGRSWKYFGSFLIVLGSILLSAAKYQRKRALARSS